MKVFDPSKCAVFCRTKDKFGGMSNFAAGFPLTVTGVKVLTTEALYQAARFPDHPEIQQAIIDQRSPLMAKMRSRANHELSRPDFDKIKQDVMLWCLLLKLIQNWDKFKQVLDETEDLPIVEFSKKDGFWGAIPQDNGFLCGDNRLGELLMKVRETSRMNCHVVTASPPFVDNFKLLGNVIEPQHLVRGYVK